MTQVDLFATQTPQGSEGGTVDEEAVSKERAPARPTCTDHCSTCSRHFHGLTAFDAHRKDGECIEPLAAISERGKPKLQLWTAAGFCDKNSWHNGKREGWDHPVEIWQGYVKEEAAAEGRAYGGVK